VEEVSELEQGVVKVVCGALAVYLVIENVHSAGRSELLVGRQGGGWSGRFGSWKGNDVCTLLAAAPGR
jgi:hypothetical protein